MKLEELKNSGLDINDEMLSKLDTYASFLMEYNEKVNLTAITNYEDIIEKHFYDSLVMCKYMDIRGTLVDVGSGAGFPGVVIKICKPEVRVILIEPTGKRVTFLNELISKLDLKDIEVIQDRGEDYSLKHREEYDYVTARAVTKMDCLIEICGAMVRLGGYFVALKGLNGKEEIEECNNAITKMGFEVEKLVEEVLPSGSSRVVGYLKKVKKTSPQLPRKYSIIKHSPL